MFMGHSEYAYIMALENTVLYYNDWFVFYTYKSEEQIL